MTCEGGNFIHFGVLPDIDLIMGVSMCADDLVDCLAKHKVADLRTDIHSLHRGSSEGVSESDRPVRRASS